jgi:hypothetical protein
MTSTHFLLCAFLAVAANAFAAEWNPVGEPDRQDITLDLFYAKRTAVRPSDGRQVTAHLAFFTSRAFRLEVVDLGAGPEGTYPTLGGALRAEGCVAGVNGGFFHPDWRPSGLMISRGSRTNQFETAKLLSGVVYSDGRGTHIVRRAQFQDHPGITALLQTGPYLVEGGQTVRGLSASDPRRRTFIATDWARALGAWRHPEPAHPRRTRGMPRLAGCPDQLEDRSSHQPRRRLLDRIFLRPGGRQRSGGPPSPETGPEPPCNRPTLNPVVPLPDAPCRRLPSGVPPGHPRAP